MNDFNSSWIERSNEVFIGTYSRFSAVLVKGDGCRLVDADGKEYLDFLAGIAVCSLGHCHPEVTKAICDQAGRLLHVSNLFHTQPQTELAELLVKNSFADRVFFGNSGAEANEAAIKLARKHSSHDRFEIISLSGSFHGRTLATVAATGQPKFHEGFEPLPAGFLHAEFGDIKELEKLISEQTCAILCEPLQGESGVRPLSREYLKQIRQLCDDNGLLLIFDEVQTGMGRTGSLFAYEQMGIVPDILTSAKALANGLPIGAMLTTEEIAESFIVGSHASTFGGNPVSAAAAVATLKVMLADGFMDAVKSKGNYLAEKLADLAAAYPQLASGQRGLGLIQGLVLTEAGIEKGQEMVQKLFERGVLINFAGNEVLRFIPPLVVSSEEIDQLIEELDRLFAEMS
jgi:acetylornithine aminotransferase/acetylornithine/N-succinyldiaminopimelate aminotransferase